MQIVYTGLIQQSNEKRWIRKLSKALCQLWKRKLKENKNGTEFPENNFFKEDK